jgi:adenylate cyclase
MERRLAAILAADVVGYSRLMGADEEATLATLNAYREVIDRLVVDLHGRVFGSAGDSVMAEFASPVEAVRCAVAIQQEIEARNADLPKDRRMRFRIGVNLGDVMAEGDNLFGDGVNVAARLEGLAKAGGVCVSGTVIDHVRNKVGLEFEDLGEQEVKNIREPVRVYRWTDAAADPTPGMAGAEGALALPDKPSIAVLPFDNMSGDPDQEFFADGIAEDVITALSRFRSLFVIARNSSFSYKGTSPDIRTVARELSVRYVVEGSVRKAGNRVRISAQLIDAASGNHLWADRFDGNLEDIFDLQDQITEQIVVAVEPEIQTRERERARRKPPESLDAWELVQRGLSHFYRVNKTDRTEAIRLFREAIALDSEFAAAHARLAQALWGSVRLGYAVDTARTIASARTAAEQAVSLDPNEPMAHLALGRVHIYSGEVEMAIGEMQTAIAVNPNFAWGHYGLGWAYFYGAGQAEQSLPHLDTALRLSPRDPMRWMTLSLKGAALRTLGRHDEAIAHCRQACQLPDAGFLPYMQLAAALTEAGQISEAQTAVEKVMQLQPALSIGFVRNRFVRMNESYLERLLDSLRKAGVPE